MRLAVGGGRGHAGLATGLGVMARCRRPGAPAASVGAEPAHALGLARA